MWTKGNPGTLLSETWIRKTTVGENGSVPWNIEHRAASWSFSHTSGINNSPDTLVPYCFSYYNGTQTIWIIDRKIKKSQEEINKDSIWAFMLMRQLPDGDSANTKSRQGTTVFIFLTRNN